MAVVHEAKILCPCLLDTNAMDEQVLKKTTDGVITNAKTSQLCQSVASLQAAVGELVITRGAYETSGKLLVAAEAVVPTLRQTHANDRTALERKLLLVKSSVELNGTDPKQAAEMGFESAAGPKATPVIAAAPNGVKLAQGHGHVLARLSVVDALKRIHFAAEISTDVLGPVTWSVLHGNGKTRKLSGYAVGTVIWVHFAALAGGKQGEWCTPVRFVIA